MKKPPLILGIFHGYVSHNQMDHWMISWEPEARCCPLNQRDHAGWTAFQWTLRRHGRFPKSWYPNSWLVMVGSGVCRLFHGKSHLQMDDFGIPLWLGNHQMDDFLGHIEVYWYMLTHWQVALQSRLGVFCLHIHKINLWNQWFSQFHMARYPKKMGCAGQRLTPETFEALSCTLQPYSDRGRRRSLDGGETWAPWNHGW